MVRLSTYPPSLAAQALYQRLATQLANGQPDPAIHELQRYSDEQRQSPLLVQLWVDVCTVIAQIALEESAPSRGQLRRVLGLITGARQLIFGQTAIHWWPDGEHETLVDGPLRRIGRDRGYTACGQLVRTDAGWRAANIEQWQAHPGLRCRACAERIPNQVLVNSSAASQPYVIGDIIERLQQSLINRTQLEVAAHLAIQQQACAQAVQELIGNEQAWQQVLADEYLSLTIVASVQGLGERISELLSRSTITILVERVWQDVMFGWSDEVISQRLVHQLHQMISPEASSTR
jgi:hypothetical protein